MGLFKSIGRLSERFLVPEIMDDPALEKSEHIRALKGLETLNKFSRSSRLIWNQLRHLVDAKSAKPLRVLDIATGAGDVPIGLMKLAASAGAVLEVEACDFSARALEFARERASAAKVAVRFFEWNAVAQGVPGGYDAIVSSLFLHHLKTSDAANLLREMGRRARRMVVINDLVRSRTNYALAFAATRLLSRSRVVHEDGPQSIAAAFTVPEMKAMARDAELDGFEIKRRFPCRFVLSWKRR